MGEIFFVLGLWLMVSGAMDIHEALKIKDSCENSSDSCETYDSDSESMINSNAVA